MMAGIDQVQRYSAEEVATRQKCASDANAELQKHLFCGPRTNSRKHQIGPPRRLEQASRKDDLRPYTHIALAERIVPG